MAHVFSDPITTAIDIGTTKICVLVGRKVGDTIEIIGMGKAPSLGLKKGVVVDINKTVESIKAAVQEAELVTGVHIDSATVGISGSHIRAFNSHGAVPIKRDGRVRELDIAAVIAAAKAIPLPEGQQILHVIPQFFCIDGQDKIQDPLGMHGVRLEAQVHIITGSIASAQNIITCCQMAGVQVADIVLEQLASAEAVLSNDERHLGVAMLDIGGGTSDFALFYNGSIRHTMVLPIAGNHVTNDIAIGLHTTVKDAERIKQLYGNVWTPEQDNNLIDVMLANGMQQTTVSAAALSSIMEQRLREMLELVQAEMSTYQLAPLMSSGFVITGGGALVNGIVPLAESIFNVPVRIGRPTTKTLLPESLNNPMYATGYGLLLYAAHKQKTTLSSSSSPMVYRVFDRMKSWIGDFF